MSPRRMLPVALLLLALVAPGALAQEKPQQVPPAGAHAVQVGNETVSYWVGPSAGVVDEDLAQGEPGSIWFALRASDARLVAYLNVTASASTLAVGNGTLALDAAPNATASANVTYSTTVADAGVVNQSYAFSGELYRDDNGTLVLLGPFSGSGTFRVDVGALVPAPPAGVPTTRLVAGAAVLVVGGGALAYGLRQRSIRRRMNEGPRRSQVMRERELEQRLEKAKAPEEAAEIRQEIRTQEVVREKRRELQILEAKRADAMKTLELLRKRHETGGLTKLQYDNMVAKKRADLARIEQEIAEMERADGGAAA